MPPLNNDAATSPEGSSTGWKAPLIDAESLFRQPQPPRRSNQRHNRKKSVDRDCPRGNINGTEKQQRLGQKNAVQTREPTGCDADKKGITGFA